MLMSVLAWLPSASARPSTWSDGGSDASTDSDLVELGLQCAYQLKWCKIDRRECAAELVVAIRHRDEAMELGWFERVPSWAWWVAGGIVVMVFGAGMIIGLEVRQ